MRGCVTGHPLLVGSVEEIGKEDLWYDIAVTNLRVDTVLVFIIRRPDFESSDCNLKSD